MHRTHEPDGLNGTRGRPPRTPTAELAVSPKPHQGVGDALRKIYSPAAVDIPPEWRELLDRIT
ncbi:hypothetical protein [Sphingomonas sp. KC8]|uniref:hypothetical protein n=1 Tax=Sphingomonas sp. KC8 TaxID=1030157 RepID=UPI0002D80C3D|nr:hypothetical protein [Sphingomonas sp. KC8]